MAITSEGRGRDNNFVNGQAGRGDVRDFRNGFLHLTYDYVLSTIRVFKQI